jgi:flagellar biosynthesis/type III secretory pathway chaperone
MTNEGLVKTYFSTSDLWNSLCELHAILFDLTCDEYSCLLENNLEELENVVIKKEEIVKKVQKLENERQKIIESINTILDEEFKITSASELLLFLEPVAKDMEQNHLMQFNRILIDIIEKIQNQNKKNQIFLNKAIDSIDKLRHEVSGKKSYNSYDHQGKMRNVGGRV